MSELVKVPPSHIGVGMYQHDIRARHLADSLDDDVASCVNLVCVNVNTAGVSLLRHVSGLGPQTARRLVEFREQNGPFATRDDLRKVSGMGEVTWNQAVGFLRVDDSEVLLDRTSLHPESYDIARQIVQAAGGNLEELFPPAPSASDGQPGARSADEAFRSRREELLRQLRGVDPVDMAQRLGVGELTVRDVIRTLRNPYFDPRDNLPAPIFRTGVLGFDELKEGMRLRGQVVNVVDFGVFVNIGMGDSSLVHISRLSRKFVRDPHFHFAVGDVLDIWVKEIDTAKKRVILTAIPPETASAPPRQGGRRERSAAGQSSRPPQRSGKPGKFERGGNRGRQAQATSGRPNRERPRKPRPVTPITQAMVEGTAPMRSFSDLLQFHQQKSRGSAPPPKPDAKSGNGDDATSAI
jgi:uncharacterized protein